MTRLAVLSFTLAVVAVGWAGGARAHGDSVSTLRLTCADDAMHLSLSLNFRDLSNWVPATANGDYPAAVLAEMCGRGNELVEVKRDGEVIRPRSFSASVAKQGMVEIEWTYPPTAGEVEVHSMHLGQLPNGHHQMFYAEDVRTAPKRHVQRALLAEQTLGTDDDTAVVDVPAAAAVMPTTGPAAVAAAPATGVDDGAAARHNREITIIDHLLPPVIGLVLLFATWRFFSYRSSIKSAGPDHGR